MTNNEVHPIVVRTVQSRLWFAYRSDRKSRQTSITPLQKQTLLAKLRRVAGGREGGDPSAI